MNEGQQGLETQFRGWCKDAVTRNSGLITTHAAMFLGKDGQPVVVMNSVMSHLKRKISQRFRQVYGHSNGDAGYICGTLTPNGVDRVYFENPESGFEERPRRKYDYFNDGGGIRYF
jgi:hypothetical protein